MAKPKLIIGLAIVAVALGGWSALRHGEAETGPEPGTVAAPAPGAAGLIATTGDGDPAAAAKALAGDPALDTSPEGLVEEPSPVPGGGVMIDLQGRFQNRATATASDSDSVVIDCAPDSAPGGGR